MPTEHMRPQDYSWSSVALCAPPKKRSPRIQGEIFVLKDRALPARKMEISLKEYPTFS